MAASVMLSSVTLKPAGFTVEKTAARGLPSLTRARPSFKIVASGVKKIKTDKPFGINGSMDLRVASTLPAERARDTVFTSTSTSMELTSMDTVLFTTRTSGQRVVTCTREESPDWQFGR